MTVEVPAKEIYVKSPLGDIYLEKLEVTFDHIERVSELYNPIMYTYSYADGTTKPISETLEFEHILLSGEVKSYQFDVKPENGN